MPPARLEGSPVQWQNVAENMKKKLEVFDFVSNSSKKTNSTAALDVEPIQIKPFSSPSPRSRSHSQPQPQLQSLKPKTPPPQKANQVTAQESTLSAPTRSSEQDAQTNGHLPSKRRRHPVKYTSYFNEDDYIENSDEDFFMEAYSETPKPQSLKQTNSTTTTKTRTKASYLKFQKRSSAAAAATQQSSGVTCTEFDYDTPGAAGAIADLDETTTTTNTTTVSTKGRKQKSSEADPTFPEQLLSTAKFVLDEPISYNLKEINELFTCKICDGYIVDATAISACQHRFCKSCIVIGRWERGLQPLLFSKL